MTLGNATRARVRLIVWCKICQHRVQPDPAEMAARYGAETNVPDWRQRLVCSRCGSRNVKALRLDADPDKIVAAVKPGAKVRFDPLNWHHSGLPERQ